MKKNHRTIIHNEYDGEKMRVEPISINTPSASIIPNSATKRIDTKRKSNKKRKDKIRKKQQDFVESIAKNYDEIPYAYEADGRGRVADHSEFDERV